jgi:glycosyltransferase involved in cell wall biosynthesis
MGDMTQAPILSIVTVCFNAAATIGDTLDSVRAQKREGVEYVVVDGASTDGTIAIVQGCDDLVDRFASEPDAGIFDAMNKGARLSTGRMLWFLNADDRLEPGALDAVLECLHEAGGPAQPIVAGHTRRVDRDGTTLAVDRYVGPGLRPAEPAHTFAHPSTVMPRALFERLSGFDASLRIAGDYDLFWRAMALGSPVTVLDRVLVAMRVGGVSSDTAPLATRIRHELEVISIQHRHAGALVAARCHLTRVGRFARARLGGAGG